MRYLGRAPHGVASTTCCQIHCAVGCRVTLTWTIRLRPCAMKTSAYIVRRVRVCTGNRSTAQIADAWFCRNVRQLCDGGRRSARRRRYARHPAGVLAGELVNQLAERRINSRPTRPSFAAPPGPVSSPRGAMPGNHSLWLDEQQRRTPVGPRSGEQRPETPIPSTEPGSRAAPLVNGELLPQGEVLEEESRPRTERPPEAAEQQRDIKHAVLRRVT
jgi:hypothetical protein